MDKLLIPKSFFRDLDEVKPKKIRVEWRYLIIYDRGR